MFAQLLQEGQVVGRVVCVDRVAAEALSVGVLPAVKETMSASSFWPTVWIYPLKVKTVQVIFLDQIETGLQESRAVLG